MRATLTFPVFTFLEVSVSSASTFVLRPSLRELYLLPMLILEKRFLTKEPTSAARFLRAMQLFSRRSYTVLLTSAQQSFINGLSLTQRVFSKTHSSRLLFSMARRISRELSLEDC